MTMRRTIEMASRSGALISMRLLTFACAASFSPVAAIARSSEQPFITLTHPIDPPRGYTTMCIERPILCKVDAADPQARNTDLRILDHVNRIVNRAIRQQPDRVTSGRDEDWRRPGSKIGAAGDCEDIALEKRYRLILAGVDPGSLFLAIGYGRQIGLHVVLIARTASGDLVLDSRGSQINNWQRTPYVWIGAQSASQPSSWFGIRAA